MNTGNEIAITGHTVVDDIGYLYEDIYKIDVDIMYYDFIEVRWVRGAGPYFRTIAHVGPIRNEEARSR